MDFNITSPKNIPELCKTVGAYKTKRFRFGAGYTDLLMELRKTENSNLTIINLAQVKDAAFNTIKSTVGKVQIGAMVTANTIVLNSDITKRFPVLQMAAHNLASTQIRQVATIGGNLCTASPSGDLICALMALKASCETFSDSHKKREILMNDFFLGLRKSALKPNEFLYTITILRNKPAATKIYSDFIKIGTRKAMECSVVSLAYHIQVDKDGEIIDAGIAIGASAPTVKFTQNACDFLIGKKIDSISEKEKETFAKLVLSYASPISDIRATAWYRKEVLFNISKSIFESKMN